VLLGVQASPLVQAAAPDVLCVNMYKRHICCMQICEYVQKTLLEMGFMGFIPQVLAAVLGGLCVGRQMHG
jgi:hypothetical protein